MGLMVALEDRSRWCFQEKYVKRIKNTLAGGLMWDPNTVLEELPKRQPNVSWQENAVWGVTCGYAAGRVARSSRRSYEGGWRMRLGWKNSIRKWCWLKEGASEIELVDELTAFMAYCSAVQGGQRRDYKGENSSSQISVTINGWVARYR